eukprot:m.123645 g.123645  ORF g.123645 m.123645 type:complete len:64 (+) comp11130_c0_seq11:1307-1498(+)
MMTHFTLSLTDRCCRMTLDELDAQASLDRDDRGKQPAAQYNRPCPGQMKGSQAAHSLRAPSPD